MSTSEFKYSALPEWYRIERETEKTINKLGSVKELDFYLSNPDEYIRRLAVIRLQKLAAKESAKALREMLDDPVESNENKYLIGWALKSILSSRDLDFFTSSSYMNKFNGNEQLSDLFTITSEDSAPSVRFDFSSSDTFSSLKLEKEDVVMERDAFFETAFDFRQWYPMFSAKLSKSLLTGVKSAGMFLIALPVILVKAVFRLFQALSENNRKRKEARITRIKAVKETPVIAEPPKEHRRALKAPKQERTTSPGMISRLETNPAREFYSKPDFRYDYSDLRRSALKKPGLFDLLKKGGFQMLYFLLAPFRFVRKHKIAVVGIIIASYLLLAYTEYGRAFTNKYMGFDMRNAPVVALNITKEWTSDLLSGLNKVTGMEEYRKQNQQSDGSKGLDSSAEKVSLFGSSKNQGGKEFLVTAQKGLNMRESPNPSSGKVGSEPLPYGSTVMYLSKSENDSAGKTWYYVEAPDGRSGWVSAKFLKEKKEG